mgnify:CR=1 FL=1
MLSVLCAAPCRAQSTTTPTDPVEAGKSAMKSGSYPWYDPTQDELKRINVKPPKAPPQTQSASKSWFEDWDFSGLKTLFESLGEVARILIYTVAAAILGLLIYFLVKVFLKRSTENDDGGDEEEEAEIGGVDRIDELPIQIAAPRGDFLSEARRRYEAGDYSGAIVYLFSYELLHLDRHQRIQLTKGKTNRQYLREVRAIPRLQAMLARTMIAFEDVFFGHHPLDRSSFEACWQEVEEFQRLAPPGGAT